MLKHRTFSALGVSIGFTYGDGYGLTVEQTPKGYCNSPWGIGVTVFPRSRTYKDGSTEPPYVYCRVTAAGMDTTALLGVKGQRHFNCEPIARWLGEDDEVYPVRFYKGVLGNHNWTWG